MYLFNPASIRLNSVIYVINNKPKRRYFYVTVKAIKYLLVSLHIEPNSKYFLDDFD